MGRGVKKFALIWWVGTNQSNVIPLSRIKKKDQVIDCITSLVWIDGAKKQMLQAKVVAIGESEEALNKIPLSDEGMIIDPSRKLFSSEVIANQKESSNEKKLIEDIRRSNQQRLNSKIMSETPIVPLAGASHLVKRRETHLTSKITTQTTGASVTQEARKSKVGDSNKLKRSHSIAVSGVSCSSSQSGPQKKRGQSPEKRISATYSSDMDHGSHINRQFRIHDENDSQMRMSSLNCGAEHSTSFPTTRYPATLNSYRHPSPRPPFFPNYNPMGNPYDTNYWYHANSENPQQNNSNMWSDLPRPHSDHQPHLHGPQVAPTGSDHYDTEGMGFNESMYPPSHPLRSSEMNFSPHQQYPWTSEPIAPQNTVVGQTNLHNPDHLQEYSESSFAPEDSEGTVLTVLTTAKNPQFRGEQSSMEMPRILTPATESTEVHGDLSGDVGCSTATVATEGHRDISGSERSNYVPTDLVNEKNPTDISPVRQGGQEMRYIGQNQADDNLTNVDDDNDKIRPRAQSGLGDPSPEDWRRTSEDEYTDEEDARDGNKLTSSRHNALDVDDVDREETSAVDTNSNDTRINLMARAIAPHLPRPAPQGLIDYQRAVLLALEMNDEQIHRSRPHINIPQSRQSSGLPAKPLPEHYYKPGEQKEEIAPCSGFYMHKDNLSLANMMAHKTGKFLWKEYVKAILDMVYDKDIANHCAQGKRNTGRPGICQRLLVGLYSKVCSIVQKSGDVVDYKKYTEVINKRGSNKRK